MKAATITQEEIITVQNAVQHDLGADPLNVYVLEGKVHTVVITRIVSGISRDEYDIEVTSGNSWDDNALVFIATAQGMLAMSLIVQVFLNEKVNI